MNAAKQVREKKMLRPNDYCPHPLCLFRTQTRDGYKECPTHGAVSRLLGVRELPERSDSALDAPTAPALLSREERLAQHDPRTCQHPHCRLEF